MYSVTQDYKDNIYELSRRVLGRVTFDISPTDLDADTNTIATSPTFIWSNNDQLDDNVRENTLKLITWEQGRTKLDGTFTFASDTSSDWGHVGWVSDAIGDQDGVFSVPQVITYLFGQTHTSAGVTVTFDTINNEYATDFTIQAFDQNNNVILTETVTDNELTQYLLLTTILDFQKIEVTINEWSVGHRRARVAEIDCGALLVYDNDKLIRFSTTEEMDLTSASLTIPEFEFVVDNTTKEFDIFNPSGIYAALEQRQRIVPELGLELTNRVEWIPLGVFLLSEWRSDAGSMTATFRGRNKLDLLDSVFVEQVTAVPGYNLKQCIEDILDVANVGGYEVDPALSAISTTGIMERRLAREALQLAAIAGCATIRVSKDNILKVETTRPSETQHQITFDEMQEEPRIELLRQTKKVTVFYYENSLTSSGSMDAIDATIEIGDIVSLDKNTLISSAARAQVVANWILSTKNERKKFTVQYRGNPALELMDLVKLDNRYVDNVNTFLTKHELRYEGYLSATLEGRTN